jgi:hypothetical protein
VKLELETLRLSATDLANHLACRHLTTLDRGLAEGRWKAPDWYRPEADVLAQRGIEHERAYLAWLEQQGRRVTRLDAEGEEGGALERTIAAMRAGADVIVQATLAAGRWLGRADVLLRVERPSRFGAWSYEALDTKLARETKAGAVLQLCLYSDLLGEIQGAHARRAAPPRLSARHLPRGGLHRLLPAGAQPAGGRGGRGRGRGRGSRGRRRRVRRECCPDLPRAGAALRHLPLVAAVRQAAARGRPPVPGRRDLAAPDPRAAVARDRVARPARGRAAADRVEAGARRP